MHEEKQNLILMDQFEKSAQELSNKERNILDQLNECLADLEERIKKEAIKMLSFGASECRETKTWNDGYNVEYRICFFIAEDDPAWDDEEDNILIELWKPYSEEHGFGIADNENHNEFQHYDHPMKAEQHCWLYHCLYDHTHLGWANLLRITSFSIDLRLEFQGSVEL